MKGFLTLTAILCIAFSAAIAGETYRWNHETHVTLPPIGEATHD